MITFHGKQIGLFTIQGKMAQSTALLDVAIISPLLVLHKPKENRVSCFEDHHIQIADRLQNVLMKSHLLFSFLVPDCRRNQMRPKSKGYQGRSYSMRQDEAIASS